MVTYEKIAEFHEIMSDFKKIADVQIYDKEDREHLLEILRECGYGIVVIDDDDTVSFDIEIIKRIGDKK